MLSLYVHIPFCLKKCPYCDFHSVEMRREDIPQGAFFDALTREFKTLSARFGPQNETIETIYFGGGTPSLCDAEHYGRFIDLVTNRSCPPPRSRRAGIHGAGKSSKQEITIEINPATGSKTYLRDLKMAGFNRISIGVQSFDDKFLRAIGRLHGSREARETIDDAADAGFDNVSIDLMWGLPGQAPREVERDMDSAIASGCRHVSAYQLTLDSKNHVAQDFSPANCSCPIYRAKVLPDESGNYNMAGQAGLSSALPSEDLAREMFLLVHGKLTSSGFEHYEISNFAKRGTVPFSAGDCPPFRSRHNLNYWRYGSWLGIGPNATSFMNGSTRLTCSKDIKNYLAQNFIYETEDIPQKTAMAEFSFMGLRTSDGIDLSEFEQRFGIPFDARWPGLKEKWLAAKMASEKNACLALTVEGMLISDELFRELV